MKISETTRTAPAGGAVITPYMTHPLRYDTASCYIGRRFDFLSEGKRPKDNVLIADFGPGYPPEGFFNMARKLSHELLNNYGVNAKFAGVENNMLTAVANCDDASYLAIGEKIVSCQFPHSFTGSLKIDGPFVSINSLAGAKIPVITNPYEPYRSEGLTSFVNGDIFDPAATGLRPDISIMANVMVYYQGQEASILSAFNRFLREGASLLVVESCQYGFNGSIFTFRKHKSNLSCDEIVLFGDPTSYEDIHDFASSERLREDVDMIYRRENGLRDLAFGLKMAGYSAKFDHGQHIPFVCIAPLRKQKQLGSIEHFMPMKR